MIIGADPRLIHIISLSNGTSTQAFGMQVSNSTIQNDSRFQRYVSGGQINGNSNMYSGPAYPVQHSNYHNTGYLSHCGQIVNGKYFPGQAPDLNTGQICGDVTAQRNDCGPREPATPVPFRNQNLINGNDSHFVPSGTNALQSCFAAQQNPWNANAPQTAPASGSSLQANRTAAGCAPYSLQALSGFGGGASAAGVQGQRDVTTSQQSQRITNFSSGESTSPSVNFYGAVDRNAFPPASQTGSRSASLCENVIDVKETQRNPLSMMAERIGELQPRNYANYMANLRNSSATGNKSASSLSASRSRSGNSLSVRNVTQVRPSFHSQNSRPDGNLSVNSPWTAQQSFQYPTAGQQHRQSKINKLRTLLQEENYCTQNSTGTTQPSVFPDAKRDVGGAARPVGPSQTPKPVPNQIPWTVAASQNSYSCGSTLQNQPQPPQRRLSDQPISDPPPYPKTQRYFVTVTQDRPGTGFTAKNVIFMNDHHASALSKELQFNSKERTPNLDSGIANGESADSRDPKQGETQLPAAITRAESGFNMHKPTNPLKCAGSSGQRAVAVVPPISQQSSNLEDEQSGIINANEGLPFQIKNVWSLTKDKCATQQKLDDLFPESAASDVEPDENSKWNVLAISALPGLTDSSSPSEEVVDFHQKTSQPPNSVNSSTCTTRALAVLDKDIKTANVPNLQPTLTEVAQVSDEISHGSSNANDSGTPPTSDAANDSGTAPSSDAANDSGTLPNSDAFGKGDKVESEKEALDFSSVPVFRWTIEKLRKLISVYEWKQNFHPVDFDIEKLHSIFGSCIDPDIPDVFKSDLYMSIMTEASCISASKEHDAIFSQIRRKCLKQVSATCHILKHNASYSENAVYKSSWLNLNEQLDDIDKEHGFPLSLRFNQHILEDKCQDRNESRSGNFAEVPNYQETVESSGLLELTEVKIPASSEGVCPSNNQVFSSQIKMSTSEKVIASEHGTLAKVPILQAAEKRAKPAIPAQTDLPAPEDIVENLADPLSSAQTAFPASEDVVDSLTGPLLSAQTDLPTSEDVVVKLTVPLSSVQTAFTASEDDVPLSSVQTAFPASEDVVDKLTDPLSSVQTAFPASDDVVDKFTDPLSSAQTAFPASEDVVDKLTDPLSSVQTAFPASEDVVDKLTDPLSSAQTAFPASEDVVDSLTGPLLSAQTDLPTSEDVVDKLTEPLSSAQTALPASVDVVNRLTNPMSSAQTDLPASEDIVSNLTDPLPPVELSVLSGEAAIKFFNEIMNEAKDNQSQALKLGCKTDGNQMDIKLPEQPVKEKEPSPMETYCCLARWLCVMSGYRDKPVCTCQKREESNLEKMKPSASINTTDMLPATRPVAEDASDNMGNAHSIHNTGGPTQPGGNVRGVNDASVLPQQQTVHHPEQSSVHASKVTNCGIHSEAETRLKTPLDHSGRGKQSNPESHPKAVSNASKVLEVETKHVNASEVRKVTSQKSVPLGRRRSSKDLPRRKIEGGDIGSTLSESASIGCDVVVAKDGTLSKAVGSTDVKDVRRTPVHKPLALTKNHNQKDVKLSEKDMMCRKQKRGISNPRSSAGDQDDPASDLEKNDKKKLRIEAVSEIKMAVLKSERTSYHDHKIVEEHEESRRQKVCKAVKHENVGNVPGSINGNKKILQMAKVLKVINKEAAGSVRLALYGSSPQKRNETLHLHKRRNGKPVKIKSEVSTSLSAGMSLDSSSEETKAFQYSPVKSVAKQQVFDRWKNSLVPEKYNHQSKHRSSLRNTTSTRARVAQITPTELPKHPKSPKRWTIVDSSKLKVPPLRLKAESLTRNKPASKEISCQTSVSLTSKNALKRVTIEERRRSLTAGPLVKMNKLVREKRKRLQAAHRPYTRHEAQIKSKYELGNPAIAPLQKDGMLQFKLLPESFNFKDSREDRESAKPKDLAKTKVAVGGQREENLKTKTWRLEGSWSKSSKSRGLTCPSGKTPGGTTQSDTVFQEYKRKHMAKGKK